MTYTEYSSRRKSITASLAEIREEIRACGDITFAYQMVGGYDYDRLKEDIALRYEYMVNMNSKLKEEKYIPGVLGVFEDVRNLIINKNLVKTHHFKVGITNEFLIDDIFNENIKMLKEQGYVVE